MAQMIAAVTRSRKVTEATSDKDDPTPIYLLTELEKVTFETNDAPSHVGDALVKRLGTKSPNVLYKALRVIKDLCLKGHPEFRRYMQRHAGPVRELTTFRGPTDPLKGEIPNQMVREAAKEASEVVFSSVTMPGAASHSRPAASSGSGRIQGFGSEQSGSSVGSSNGGYISSSGSKYSGFGNPNMKQPDPKAAHSTLSSYLNPQAWMESAQEAANAASQLVTGYKAAPQSRATPFLRDPSDNYKAPSIGGPPAPVASNMWPQDGRSNSNPSAATSEPAPVPGSLSVSPEARLVESMCAAGAVRVQPRQEDLQRFVASVSGMDGELVAKQLVAQVEAGAWQAALRALFAMEAVTEKGNGASCQALTAFLKQDPGPIKRACSSPQASVAKRADSVLSLLGISESAAGPSKASASSGASAPAANMIDFDDGAQAPPPEQTKAAVDFLGDLLGGDPSHAAAPAAAAPASTPGGMFDGLSLGSSAPPPAPAAPTPDSMFEGLMVGSAPSTETHPQPQAETAVPSGAHLPGADGELADLFTSLATSEAPAGQQAVPTLGTLAPPGLMAQPGQAIAPGPGMATPQIHHQQMQMQMMHQQQAMMMGMMPGMPQMPQGMMMMMTPQQQQRQQQAMLAMMHQRHHGMMAPQGMAMPVPMQQQGMSQMMSINGPQGLAGRAQAPNIFHGNGGQKHSATSTPTFPEKHEPAFDFITDHLK